MTRKHDPHNLERFVLAHNADDTYAEAIRELRAGKKRSCWMWFVFPRLIAPDYSATSAYYAFANRWAARAYLRHPVLGPRLLECVRAVLASDRTLLQIFGPVDAPKARHCAALFASLGGANPIFRRLLVKP